MEKQTARQELAKELALWRVALVNGFGFGGQNGVAAFRIIIELASGTFEFSTAENEFPVVITVSSNTNFLLDVLTELDNERAEQQGLK